MSAGTVDTRNFAESYEDTVRRVRLLEQQISNPEIQVGSSGGGTAEFDEIVIANPGVGSDVVLGFTTVSPTGLSALTSTYLEEVYIDASWTAPTPEPAEYELEISRRTSPGVYDTPRVYRTAGTSLRVVVPLGGVTYGVRVSAINRLGIRSAFTSRIDVAAAVDSTIPPAPTGLIATAGLNSIIVTFDRMTSVQAPDMQNGAGIYRIQLSTNDFAAITSEKFTSSNVESFTGLTQGTNYKVRVAAVDPSGNQGPYATSGNVAPGYVTNTNIATNSINGDRITADTITGAKIIAGTINGDRIIANTLEANRLTTSTLTSADITIAGGSLIVGTPVTGDGALMNSQGFKLYKDGAITVNMDALTGDATFTGNLVGSRMYGGEIISANLVGEGQNVNIIPNPGFNVDLTGWTTVVIGGTGAAQRVASPATPLNTDPGEAPALRLYSTGGAGGAFSGAEVESDIFNIGVSDSDLIRMTFKSRAVGNSVSGNVTAAVRIYWYDAADVFIASFLVASYSFPAGATYPTQTYNCDFFVPAGGKKFKIRLGSGPNVKDGEVWFDDIFVTKTPSIRSFQFNSRSEDESSVSIASRVDPNGATTHNIFFEEKFEETISGSNWDVPSTITSRIDYVATVPGQAVHTLKIESGNYASMSAATLELISSNRETTPVLHDSLFKVIAGRVSIRGNPRVNAQQSVLDFNGAGQIDLKVTRSSDTITDNRLWMKASKEIELYTNTDSGTSKLYLKALASEISTTNVSTGAAAFLTVTPTGLTFTSTGTSPPAIGGPWNVIGGAWTTFPVNSGAGWAIEGGTMEPAGYRRIGDLVYWRGSITNAGTSPTGTFATMPTSYRPVGTVRRMLGVHRTGLGGVFFARVDIANSGACNIAEYWGSGTNSILGVTMYLADVCYSTT